MNKILSGCPCSSLVESSLIHIDSKTGELLDRYQTKYTQLSLRHLTRSDDDRIFVGAQLYRDTETPLI
ncbi:MAG: hypothetical protein ACJAUT_000617, partial [Cellvibrionaceae bacterium]